jgi:hypothetical protein
MPHALESDFVREQLELRADWLDLARVDIAKEVARCEIDHDVGAVAEVGGGLTAARARLEEFVSDGLDAYDERRREPSDAGGSSPCTLIPAR